MLAKARGTWKVQVIPRPQILWGGFPVMSVPLKRTRPASGFCRPMMLKKSVVLPAPLGPIMLKISPFRGIL
jgi:hypothetical protein